MTRKIKVRVTANHIAQGRRADYDSCPVALALAEAVGARPGATGATGRGGVLDIPGAKDIPMPRRVGEWIEHFDVGEPVKPFTFTLTVPD